MVNRTRRIVMNPKICLVDNVSTLKIHYQINNIFNNLKTTIKILMLMLPCVNGHSKLMSFPTNVRRLEIFSIIISTIRAKCQKQRPYLTSVLSIE